MGRLVTLVAGPPCAGKTTWVESVRMPGDLAADFDAVASELGSTGKWMHTRAVGDAADRRVLDLIDQASAITSGRAWVIRSVPDPWDRQALAEQLRADRVVVLKPPLVVLLNRARSRPLAEETKRAIWRWLDRYAPATCDEELISGALARPV